jgi:hypothetical protein
MNRPSIKIATDGDDLSARGTLVPEPRITTFIYLSYTGLRTNMARYYLPDTNDKTRNPKHEIPGPDLACRGC